MKTAAGQYEMDLAEALLSRPQWLPQQQFPIAFEQVAFDVHANLPISLFEHVHVLKPQVSRSPLCVVGVHAMLACI